MQSEIKDIPTVLIAGGSGLIGTALFQHLSHQGYRVIMLTRNPKKSTDVFWNPTAATMSLDQLDQVDILINLVGENIGAGRWTKKRKAQIIASRVQSTKFLAAMLPKMSRLKYYIGASGINCYGQLDDKVFSESQAYGSDFLSSVVQQWEEAHQDILKQVKGCVFRVSMVLTPHGGTLHYIKKPINLGFGAILGSGHQNSPWIHIDDLCRMMHFAIDKNLTGTYNTFANYNTNKEMTILLAKWLRRPLFLPRVPGFLLKLLLGERAVLILADLKASNQKIKDAGFSFNYSSLDEVFQSFFSKL